MVTQTVSKTQTIDNVGRILLHFYITVKSLSCFCRNSYFHETPESSPRIKGRQKFIFFIEFDNWGCVGKFRKQLLCECGSRVLDELGITTASFFEKNNLTNLDTFSNGYLLAGSRQIFDKKNRTRVYIYALNLIIYSTVFFIFKYFMTQI